MFGKSSILDYFRKPADPKELVRKWQADLRAEQRSLERQIRDLTREEKTAQKQACFLCVRRRAARGGGGVGGGATVWGDSGR